VEMDDSHIASLFSLARPAQGDLLWVVDHDGPAGFIKVRTLLQSFDMHALV
jgi:hypothetical protein